MLGGNDYVFYNDSLSCGSAATAERFRKKLEEIAAADTPQTYFTECFLRNLSSDDAACRISSDRFVVFLHISNATPEAWNELLLSAIARSPLPFKVNINTGIYVIGGAVTAADAMADHAILAQASIKGSHTQQYSFSVRTC